MAEQESAQPSPAETRAQKVELLQDKFYKKVGQTMLAAGALGISTVVLVTGINTESVVPFALGVGGCVGSLGLGVNGALQAMRTSHELAAHETAQAFMGQLSEATITIKSSTLPAPTTD